MTAEPAIIIIEPANASVAFSKLVTSLNSSNGEGGGVYFMINAIIQFIIIINCYKYLRV